MTQRLNPDENLDSLIRRLNEAAQRPEIPGERDERQSGAEPGAPREGAVARPERWPLQAESVEGREWLDRLLHEAQKAHASDLLLVPGAPPVARVNGRLVPLEQPRLTPGASGMLCAALVPISRRAAVQAGGSADFAFSHEPVGRLRCNVHRERGHWAAAVRLLPDRIPDLAALNLPEQLSRFAALEHGLVLCTGPTGSGKSTTLAALLREVLSKRKAHVITIEDPVEYEHPHDGSVVEHVEIGRDAQSFAHALRAALRQDPDVLLVGEMRDPESISIAITAAETGHLVLSTLHTGDAPQTIHRILDSYPARQIDTVRAQIAVSLGGIVSQQLMPRSDGKGRVPAVEILVGTHAVRNLVRQGKIPHIRSQLTLEKTAGMLSLDQSLAALVHRGLVDAAEARTRARDASEFEQHLQRARPG